MSIYLRFGLAGFPDRVVSANLGPNDSERGRGRLAKINFRKYLEAVEKNSLDLQTSGRISPAPKQASQLQACVPTLN